MKIVLLGSALPVRFGHPGQRVSHALRQALTQVAGTAQITVDCLNRDWADRHLLRAGDRFIGHGAALQGQSGPGGALPEDLAGFTRGWFHPARAARLDAALGAMAPDLVVLSDPLLAGLVPDLAARGHRLACLDTGAAALLRLGAARLGEMRGETEMATLFARLAEELTRALPRSTHLPIQIEQERSDLFFTQTGKMLMLSTGIRALDRVQLAALAQARDFLRHQSGVVPVAVLIGFDPDLVAGLTDVEIHPRWTRLHTSLGTSDVLFLPVLVPRILPFIPAALSVGTSVVLRSLDQAEMGIPAGPGLLAAGAADLPAVLAMSLSEPFRTALDPRTIAQAAQARIDAARPDPEALAAWLAAEMKRPEPARDDTAPRTVPPHARTPFAEAPRVLYTPASRLLLLQCALHGWADIEEVSLRREDGTEITRLAPGAAQKSQPRFVLEGGVVTELAALGGALRIVAFRDVEEVAHARIPVDTFETVPCGLSALHYAQGMLSGILWEGQDDAPPIASALRINGEILPLAADPPREIAGLDIVARRFRAFLPAHLHTGIRIELASAEAEFLETDPPPQKPMEVHVAALAGPGKACPAPLQALAGRHRGQRAWIVGNGPSVCMEDLARIPDEDVIFCFNRFYLSYADNPLREDYVVSADTLMIQDFGQEMIERSAGLPLFCIPPRTVMDLDGDYVLLRPGGSSVPVFSLDPAKFVTVGGSSAFVALQMAWYMGIRDVVLYGMDYSFTLTLQRDPRFPFPVSFDEGNHFIKGYRSAKPWCPPTWRDISAGFLNARVVFDMLGGRVRNATRGGLLETFPRASFDAILEETGPTSAIRKLGTGSR